MYQCRVYIGLHKPNDECQVGGEHYDIFDAGELRVWQSDRNFGNNSTSTSTVNP